MNNDSTVTPAPFEKIASLLHATWVKGLVQKRPRELFLSVQLQSASSVDADVLLAKVGVRPNTVVSPVREDSSPSRPTPLVTGRGPQRGQHRSVSPLWPLQSRLHLVIARGP